MSEREIGWDLSLNPMYESVNSVVFSTQPVCVCVWCV
jgi:hypothetical protein